MRRMKEMSKFQPGMSFYSQMPDSYMVVLNSDHKLVKEVLEDTKKNVEAELKPIESDLKGQEARLAALHQSQANKKPEEITKEEKDDLQNTEKVINDERSKKNKILDDYAKDNKIVHQLIDLALLQNGMLKGEALDKFLKRSVELIG
jgi:molecular chaperone HtpG